MRPLVPRGRSGTALSAVARPAHMLLRAPVRCLHRLPMELSIFSAKSPASMKIPKIIFLTTILISCTVNEKDNELYELMKFVIEDQKLNKAYGLEISPEENCTIGQADEEFLKTLILTENSDTVELSPVEMMFEIGKLTKCLTEEDVALMVEQKELNNEFKWDNNRLELNSSKGDKWYSFSVPLFSKDRTKAVMMIRELCPGLCGRGWTLLLTKDNKKWTSEMGQTWRH